MGILDAFLRLAHPGEEFDEYTQSWVRKGWPAERQSLVEAEVRRRRRGEHRDGTCLDCGQPIDDHPMPERMWRRGADLCAQVTPGTEEGRHD